VPSETPTRNLATTPESVVVHQEGDTRLALVQDSTDSSQLHQACDTWMAPASSSDPTAIRGGNNLEEALRATPESSSNPVPTPEFPAAQESSSDLLSGGFYTPSSDPSEFQQRPKTRLQAGIRKPKVYKDGTICYGCLAYSDEPISLDDALSSKNWKLAMDIEYDALMKNKTWHLVPPQKGRNLIDCKWV
jgi:hypothetical protein